MRAGNQSAITASRRAIPGVFPIGDLLAAAVVFALLASVPIPVNAQAGGLYGTVYDQKTRDILSGASVFVIGTTLGASTDLDGNYNIPDIPSGTYNLRISFIGYGTKIVTGVIVESGKRIELKLGLDSIGTANSDAFKIDDIVVSADRVLSTSAAVLAERMRAATIGDGISAQQISMSPDATSGDALKRVTGLSVVDNKFVYVRGVTDRYNGTTLNGVSVTSTDTDTDKKSFSFDLIPANLLASTIVVKTATPDLPGDFTGGLVKVNTLEFPEKRLMKVSYSSSIEKQTTGEDFFTSQGGGRDWLGYDDGSRDLPGGLKGNALARVLSNTWVTRTRQAPINNSFSLSLGDRFRPGRHEIGVIAALSFKNSYDKSEFLNSPAVEGVKLFEFEGTRYERSVLWGSMINLHYKPAESHKFSFKNNFVQSAQEAVRIAQGFDVSTSDLSQQTIEWDQRSLYLAQLSGEHTIKSWRDLTFEWKGFCSTSKAEEPDRKYVAYQKNAYGNYVLQNNYRTWSKLDETSNGFSADVSIDAGPATFKMGALTETRERDYSIEAFFTDVSSVRSPNWNLMAYAIDSIFDGDNYGERKFTFAPVTDLTGTYAGENKINAYYAMLDVPFEISRFDFRAVGGARVEDWKQTITSGQSAGDPDPVISPEKKSDVLPSINLTYFLKENANLRFAYSRSVNRPEFRERADVKYFDFNNLQNVKGQPNLRRALVKNYDVRVEIFPELNEVFAVSGFYKSLENPIEIKLEPAPDRYRRTWFNSPTGKNYGWELEVRKSLGFLGRYFEDFLFTTNYTRVWSAIEYTRVDETKVPAVVTQEERDMQGQSPWMINGSLIYSHPTWGTSVSVLYNKIARRLYAIADIPEENVYEEARTLLDVAVSQELPSGLTAKFTAKDILADDQELTFLTERVTFSKISRATSYSLSFSYSF